MFMLRPSVLIISALSLRNHFLSTSWVWKKCLNTIVSVSPGHCCHGEEASAGANYYQIQNALLLNFLSKYVAIVPVVIHSRSRTLK